MPVAQKEGENSYLGTKKIGQQFTAYLLGSSETVTSILDVYFSTWGETRKDWIHVVITLISYRLAHTLQSWTLSTLRINQLKMTQILDIDFDDGIALAKIQLLKITRRFYSGCFVHMVR